jgi:hypothetical protein
MRAAQEDGPIETQQTVFISISVHHRKSAAKKLARDVLSEAKINEPEGDNQWQIWQPC